MSSRLERPANAVATGVGAGLAAGISVQVFLIVVTLASGRPPSAIPQAFEFIASVLVGHAALGNPALVPLGIVLHFLVSIGWALGYVYLARSTPQLAARPIVSGLAFGVVVYFAMQVVLVGANAYRTPTVGSLLEGLTADSVFYGLPLALLVSRFARRP